MNDAAGEAAAGIGKARTTTTAQAKKDGADGAMDADAGGSGAIWQQAFGAACGGGGQDLPQQAIGFDACARDGAVVNVTTSAAANSTPTSLLSFTDFSVAPK